MKIKSLQFWYITLSLCILRLTKSSTEKGILPSQSVNMTKQSKHAHECQKTIIWKEVQVYLYFYIIFYKRKKKCYKATSTICLWLKLKLLYQSGISQNPVLNNAFHQCTLCYMLLVQLLFMIRYLIKMFLRSK